jgi:hypothetical protein
MNLEIKREIADAELLFKTKRWWAKGAGAVRFVGCGQSFRLS